MGIRRFLLYAGLLALALPVTGLVLFGAFQWGWMEMPIPGGWCRIERFGFAENPSRYHVLFPSGSSETKTVLITIAHPKDRRLIEDWPLRNLIGEAIHLSRLAEASDLVGTERPIIVRYHYYWEEEDHGAAWLKGSNQDRAVSRHIYDASPNFKAFIADLRRKYAPSRILGYGFSFQGTALLALCERNPDLLDGIVALGSPTVSMALPQIKDELPSIAHLPLYFAWGDKDRVLGGDMTMLQRERPFYEALQQVVKNFRYIAVPGAGHGNFPILEKKRALDWLFRQTDREKSTSPPRS